MDDKEEGILLGELKSFRDLTITRLNTIETKVDSLDKFKIKVTLIMAGIMGVIEIAFRLYEINK